MPRTPDYYFDPENQPAPQETPIRFVLDETGRTDSFRNLYDSMRNQAAERMAAELLGQPPQPPQPPAPQPEAWDVDDDDDDDFDDEMDREDQPEPVIRDESSPYPNPFRLREREDRVHVAANPVEQPLPDIRTSICCPRCRNAGRVAISSQTRISRNNQVIGGANCVDCRIAFEFSCDILRGVGTSQAGKYNYGFTLHRHAEIQMPITKVFVVHDQSEQEILGVYTSEKWPAMLKAYGCKSTEFQIEPMNQTAFVVYIVVTNDENCRIVKVSTDREVAKKVSASVNGIVTMREALPEDRRPREVRFYQYYVLLDSDGEVVYNESRHRMKKLLPTETISYTVTHRRAYQSMTPHRLEVIGPDRDRTNDLASHVARMTDGKSRAEVEEMFEFNVDVGFKYGPKGWEQLCQVAGQSTN